TGRALRRPPGRTRRRRRRRADGPALLRRGRGGVGGGRVPARARAPAPPRAVERGSGGALLRRLRGRRHHRGVPVPACHGIARPAPRSGRRVERPLASRRGPRSPLGARSRGARPPDGVAGASGPVNAAPASVRPPSASTCKASRQPAALPGFGPLLAAFPRLLAAPLFQPLAAALAPSSQLAPPFGTHARHV